MTATPASRRRNSAHRDPSEFRLRGGSFADEADDVGVDIESTCGLGAGDPRNGSEAIAHRLRASHMRHWHPNKALVTLKAVTAAAWLTAEGQEVLWDRRLVMAVSAWQPCRVTDAPAGHGIGLGDAVDGQRAVCMVRRHLRE